MNDKNKKDIIAIGNAMVDVFIKSDLNTIKNYGVNHDSMNLIDENKKNQLHKENEIHKMTPCTFYIGTSKLIAPTPEFCDFELKYH